MLHKLEVFIVNSEQPKDFFPSVDMPFNLISSKEIEGEQGFFNFFPL